MYKPATIGTYKPVVLGVSQNPAGYPIVTLSLWPGGTLSVTLTVQHLDAEQAKEAALSIVPNILALIGVGP
jgi:hypothetical protein